MASPKKKRKRQAEESFRKNFRELQDTGVPDTGPKRPKNRRVISLTPSEAGSEAARARASGAGGRSSGSRGRQRKKEGTGGAGGRGGRRRSGRRSAEGAPTPRTKFRSDIRDLINSAVEKGDVVPAPARTVLTPLVQPSPQPPTSQQDHSVAAINSVESLSTTVTEMEVGRRAELESTKETHMSLAAETPANIVEETPTEQSRVLRSALKGVHSLSSLRKRSALSHTPFSVTFRENITVTEYSPENAGSDLSLGSASSSSSALSTPSPLTHKSTAASPAGRHDGVSESVREGEPLDEEHDTAEDEEEERDEEDEEEEVQVKLRTPHLAKKPTPSPSPAQNSARSVRVQKAASRKGRKPKTSPSSKESQGPAKTLSRTLIKNIFMSSGKRKMTAEAAALVVKFSEVYLKRCSQDLAEYAAHAGRKTVDMDDAVLLMRRQRFISDSASFEYLANTHLPLEYVEELLPCAVAGKDIVPTRVK